MLAELTAQTQHFIGTLVPTVVVEQSHPLISGLSGFAMIAAAIIGYIGVAIMMYGAFRVAYDFVKSMITGQTHVSRLRIELGKYLALGLEFLIGKDIIGSIVEPTWDDLGKLGAIIVLRTVITIFLSRELKEVEEEIKVEREEVDSDKEAKHIKVGHRQE